jgi:hypothetical protein
VHFVGLVSRKMVNGSFHKVRTSDDTLIRREPWERDMRFNFKRWDEKAWTGLIWVRAGKVDRLL